MSAGSSQNPTPESASGKTRSTGRISALMQAAIRGGLGFGIVSVGAFAAWAFGGRWFYEHSSEAGLYGACTVVFLVLSGVVLHPLLNVRGSVLQFYAVFVPAFLAYALVWCMAWFALRFGAGEWLGSLLGSAAFVAITPWRRHCFSDFLRTTLVVFALHSAGYFLGGKLMNWMLSSSSSWLFGSFSKSSIALLAKLAWGMVYGVGFGAGIGYVFAPQARRPANPV